MRPGHEQDSFVAAHPDLYRKEGRSPARLRISGGRLALGSLAGNGFAVGGELDFASMRAMPAARQTAIAPALDRALA